MDVCDLDHLIDLAEAADADLAHRIAALNGGGASAPTLTGATLTNSSQPGLRCLFGPVGFPTRIPLPNRLRATLRTQVVSTH